jgi:hypothetical protein
VSFDVFFQGFLGGGSSERGGSEMRDVLAPHISEEDEPFFRVRVGDGEADVYLHDGVIANHVSGRDPWDLLIPGARVANWVIIPVGCPTFLTRLQARARSRRREPHGRVGRAHCCARPPSEPDVHPAGAAA